MKNLYAMKQSQNDVIIMEWNTFDNYVELNVIENSENTVEDVRQDFQEMYY